MAMKWSLVLGRHATHEAYSVHRGIDPAVAGGGECGGQPQRPADLRRRPEAAARLLRRADRPVAEHRPAGRARRAVRAGVLQPGRLFAFAQLADDRAAPADHRDLRPADQLPPGRARTRSRWPSISAGTDTAPRRWARSCTSGHGNFEDVASWTVPHWRPTGGGYQLPESTATTRPATVGGPRGAATECADVPDTAYADGMIADEAIARLRAARPDARRAVLSGRRLPEAAPAVRRAEEVLGPLRAHVVRAAASGRRRPRARRRSRRRRGASCGSTATFPKPVRSPPNSSANSSTATMRP